MLHGCCLEVTDVPSVLESEPSWDNLRDPPVGQWIPLHVALRLVQFVKQELILGRTSVLIFATWLVLSLFVPLLTNFFISGVAQTINGLLLLLPIARFLPTRPLGLVPLLSVAVLVVVSGLVVSKSLFSVHVCIFLQFAFFRKVPLRHSTPITKCLKALCIFWGAYRGFIRS